MTTVGRLAKRFGLSRSTLLYYDRIGLLCPSGHMKGEYRHYSPEDQERLERIVAFRRAGLSLDEIGRVLDAPESGLTRALEQRLDDLSGEMRALREQQRFILTLLGSAELPADGVLDKATWTDLLSRAGFSEADMRNWHAQFEARSPEHHLRFLQLLCIPRDEIEIIRAWAANPLKMEKIRQASSLHMEMLFKFFEGIQRKAPGGRDDTLAALDFARQAAPDMFSKPGGPRILDLGCGSGRQTLVLAEQLPQAHILASDLRRSYLDDLDQAARDAGLSKGITTHAADMNTLDQDPVIMEKPFDLIWAEGSLFIMGMENALKKLPSLLAPGGLLACSDAVWTRDPDSAPEEVVAYAGEVFPGMPDTRGWLDLAVSHGWEPVGHFLEPAERWHEYYAQYDRRIPEFLAQVQREHPHDRTRLDAAQGLVAELTREAAIYRSHPDWYTYLFAVLRRP